MTSNWRRLTRQFYRMSRVCFNQELLPYRVLLEMTAPADGAQVYPKLPFHIFVPFMVRALLTARTKPSTRRLARLSRRPTIQWPTKVPGVSHQAIATRLRTINLESLRRLFQEVSRAAGRLLSRGFRRRARLRLFDVTTREVSEAAAAWAADNGDKKAVRLAVGLNGVTDLPTAALDASDTTSDNTVFPAIVAHLKAGDTVVLDAGFTRLRNFLHLLKNGAHFVARFARIYTVQVLHAFQLPRGQQARFEEWHLMADERVLVGTPESGGPLEARRVHWWKLNEKGEEVHRFIWTDRFDLTPKRLFEIDRIRWRLEVQFRWLKSELGLAHLPTYDWQGVQAYFLLMMLAWISLRVFAARQCGIPVDQFSCASALDAWETSMEEYLLTAATP